MAKKKGKEKGNNTGNLKRTAEEGLDLAKDVNAQMWVKENIIPEIDALIDKHKNGSGISKAEIEETFDKILGKMVRKGLMTQDEKNDYTKEPDNPGNDWLGRPKEYDKRSQFQIDIEVAVGGFNEQGMLDSANLKSTKDKLLHGISRVCTSLGFDDLAASCRKSMSTGQQTSLERVESKLAAIAKKVAAPGYGHDYVRTAADDQTPAGAGLRIREQTEEVLKQRQGKPSDSGRSR